MSGNRSSAVMQQRAEPPDSFDDFPTHPWATRALCEQLIARGHPLHLQHAWDPACNRGFMARPMGEYFDRVLATDVFDYGYDGMAAQCDFLLDWPGQIGADVDWVVSNPPFNVADQFIRMALSEAKVGVAMFVRVAFDEGQARYENLFRYLPEAYAMPFVERVPLHRGKLRDPARRYFDPKANGGGGAWKKPSTATAYQWLVWLTAGCKITEKQRIAPCRDRLISPGDYPIRYADEEGQPGAGFCDDRAAVLI